ncbi:hypothetical protein CANARDRAFT_5828 [[Candida] arabinofermentans NRRL YB-2248]|uniref:Phosphatidylserine decarboxylase proenzyme 2 n=1 Tax=[Candida] arabinofermentans NRRL YB-2248 TaxID=983967 RepID=A0A1E4T6E4_9ASCO|nr:hypothetical protein CANARDRAFT_5828 [[Candida] arabinofermentans NRRL YB-2248]
MAAFKNRKYSNISLNITICEAKDLLVNPKLPSSVLNCNPKCYIKILPYASLSTSKVKNSVSPQWNTSLKIRLKNPPRIEKLNSKQLKKLPIDSFIIVNLVIWDKKSTKKSYLGELRLSLIDILNELKNKDDSSFKWFQLYSSKGEQRFVTGSLRCKFSISSHKSRRRGHKQSSTKLPGIIINDEVVDDLKNMSLNTTTHAEQQEEEDEDEYEEEEEDDDVVLQKDIGQLDVSSEIEQYLSSLQSFLTHVKQQTGRNPLDVLKIDDQGYYPSDVKGIEIADYLNFGLDDDEYDNDTEANHQDEEEDDDTDITPTISNESKYLKLPISAPFSKSGSTTSLSTFYSSVDDSGAYSSTASDLPLSPPQTGVGSLSAEKRKRFSNLKSKKRKDLNNRQYEFNNKKQMIGMLFLEIISASGLPPLYNSTRTGYDMDPFVVISFGAKVFRTSWRKHTLNPIFNERLVFEVYENEKSFDLTFNILDKDYVSFNDQVCARSIPIKQLITTQQPSMDDGLEIKVIEKEEEQDLIYKKKIFGKNPMKNLTTNDYSEILKTLEINMDINESTIKKYKQSSKVDPKLKIRTKFEPYSRLRHQLFKQLLTHFQGDGFSDEMDIIELGSFLNTLGSDLDDDEITLFFENHNRKPWVGDKLKFDEIIEELERVLQQRTQLKNPSTNNNNNILSSPVKFNNEPVSKHIIQITRCPSCFNTARSRDDVDIIRHLAICCSKDWSSVTRILKPSYTTPDSATRRWYSKALIKIAYGKLELGKNNANILVQDRDSGIIIEEKMSVYVRLGIKLLYRSFKRGKGDKKNSEKVRKLLRNLSFKQGSKFDSPQSKFKIESFIKFHSLDLSDCLIQDISKYETFNDFFYRKLKPTARPNDCPNNPKIAVSGADSRCCVFPTIQKSQEIWIKGRNFTVSKLLGSQSKFNSKNYEDSSIVIFRLAPQDYHRFHSSFNGKITAIHKIEGEYYTVNPMAIRSKLDVFSENVRVLIEIDTVDFGKVIMIAVGAMMVGSIILTVEVGDTLNKGDEVGYFKFGGSTILLLIPQGKIIFDSDLVNNSMSSIETLVRVGMSIGHTPDEEEYVRTRWEVDDADDETRLKIIRTLTGPGMISDDSEKIGELNDVERDYTPSWEVQNLDLDDALEFEIQEAKYDELP